MGDLVMDEFKLQIYFNMYKDLPIGNRKKFKAKFIKKHGKFRYLPELIFQIEKYQYNAFGEGISIDSYSTGKDKGYRNRLANSRRWYRFGSKEESRKRGK